MKTLQLTFNVINITTDVRLQYILVNKEPTKIYDEKMIKPKEKTNSIIKREIPITYGLTETKVALFCGKFSMMRQYLMVFLFSRTVESHI